jgi:hypothetical protein
MNTLAVEGKNHMITNLHVQNEVRKMLILGLRRMFLALLILLVSGLASPVLALCELGTTTPCFLNGHPGTKECMSNGWGPCITEAEPVPTVSGTLRPKYYILAVIYAPPGTQGGKSSSSVSYGNGSTTGTTVSASSSFKQNYSVSVSAEAGFLGNGGEVGASFGYGRNTSNSQALDIKKTTTHEISTNGPSQDGIDHDHDLIYLWLNPTINMTLSSTGAAWSIGNSGLADIQYVYVGWLKNPSQMPPGLTQRLQVYGITTADYTEMLKADPFANGVTTIDPERFQPDSLNTTFPYEPPFAPGEPVPLMKFTAVYSNTNTSSSTVQNEYSVGLNVSGGGSFLGLVKAKIKNQNTWTWTNTRTNSASTGTSESASVTVGGPAYGYIGPTDMVVYYDVLYKSFLFAPVETSLPLALSGTVQNKTRTDLSGKEVIVIANGTTYRTFTNAKGEYHIYGHLSGPVLLHVDSVWKPIAQLPVGNRIDLVLP